MGRSPNLPSSPGTPWATQAVGAALSRHETLAALLQRVRDSRARLACIQALVPPGLRDAVEAGPLDDTEWTLLVRHAGAAAKLRQCVPQLEAVLAEAGHPPRRLRVKLAQPR
ncbi:MAG: hypothetical protein ACK57B_12135 [Betaproteobacteria bacterium]|jgi:hypothetical protein